MPYYEYECSKCGQEYKGISGAIFKRISEYDRPEFCECGASEPMQRLISPGHFVGEKVQEAEFNHGLGCVTRNKQHRNEIAKRQGLVEVGNDKPDSEPEHIPYEI